MHLPEVPGLLLKLDPNFVAASRCLLMLHRAEYSCEALNAFDQRLLIFPL